MDELALLKLLFGPEAPVERDAGVRALAQQTANSAQRGPATLPPGMMESAGTLYDARRQNEGGRMQGAVMEQILRALAGGR